MGNAFSGLGLANVKKGFGASKLRIWGTETLLWERVRAEECLTHTEPEVVMRTADTVG